MTENWQRAGFGLYVHWPFCQAKCPYCDFNSHVWERIDQDRWAAAYVSELSYLEELLPGRVLRSIYFGGGTPSLMHPETVDRVLKKASQVWSFSNDIEITLEANPTSVEASCFAAYRDAGVNRLSLGVQALNDRDLKRLGRLHSRDEAIRALDVARSTFERVNFDLIYARQDQTLKAWRDELGSCLSMKPDHLSLYQLTIEPGTAFGKRHRLGKLHGLPDEDLSADMFELTSEMTGAAGLQAYEISNYAHPGHESRHNMIYWDGGDYAAVGPGAHGRFSLNGARYSSTAPSPPSEWLSKAENESGETAEIEKVTLNDQVTEYLLMSLRLSRGADLKYLEELSKCDFDKVLRRVEEGDLPVEKD